MSVDKNLFLYDLAVVTIMKGEEPYVKEWIDYHILAGVDHFFIYDNGSTPEFKEILQPYIDADIVTYIAYPGKARQFEAFNAAVRDYKFLCRYMAFIDGDEFIMPKNKPTIAEVVDDILSTVENSAALTVNWKFFGSNNLETADYNQGVLERFTRCDEHINRQIKTIANPRKINFFCNSHFAMYFNGHFAVNENGVKVPTAYSEPPTAEKIVMHHYYMKSREEYEKKVQRGTADALIDNYNAKRFSHDRDNEIFDNSILKYRSERLAAFSCDVKKIPADNESRCEKVFKALTSTLLIGFEEDDTINFFENPENRYEYFDRLVQFFDKAPAYVWQHKAETFLTCFAASSYLKENLLDEYFGSLFEEFSLNALVKALRSLGTEADLQLLIKTLPKILATPYPVVNDLRKVCYKLIPLIMDKYRLYDMAAWQNFVHFDYVLQMLDVFDNYNHK